MQSRKPFSTAGKKPFGTAPPTTRSANSKESLSQGSNSIHITELSVAAGLLLVPPLDRNLFPNGLAVSDLRLFSG